MASSPQLNQDDRQRRLLQIAAEWGIESPPDSAPLARPPATPVSSGIRNPDDDFQAEELLKRRRLANGQLQNGQGGMKRAFTVKNKKNVWDPREIFEALDAHVANAGSSGVAEALIQKLLAAGGDLNVANMKTKTSVLTRRRSIETLQRGKVLQKAIENGQADTVAVLVPYADSLTLDTALPIALRSGNIEISELLLRYGANASQTADGQDAFRQMCIMGGQSDMVALILQSDGRPPPSWVSQAMVDAARKGCAETVLRLSRSTADGSYNNGEALKEAVSQCRVDVALSIVMGKKAPNTQTLNEAFSKVFTHATIMPNEKMAFTEILLCAGAAGDVVSAALVQACHTGFYEMIQMLVSYGASIEFQDAKVLRDAIAKGNTNLARILLSEASALSPVSASKCVDLIPKRIGNEERYLLLTQLLRKGAGGPALHNVLVDSIEAEDMESVKLLLTPQFPGGKLATNNDLRRGPRAMVYDGHETADINQNGGSALQLAVLTGNVPMTKLMLASKPSQETLVEIFPCINNLSPVDRYQMADLFLATGLSGPCVHTALQEAIDEEPGHRDERLIKLLLQHDADVNFNDGATLLSAVEHGDVGLLETLLKSKPTPHTTAMAVPRAMTIKDLTLRAKMISLLLNAGAGLEGKAVSEALVTVLQKMPTDTRLLDILLKQGKADVNFSSGTPVVLAIQNDDPRIVELLLQAGKAAPQTLSQGLLAISELALSPKKAAKLDSILKRTKDKDSINDMLVTEVQNALKTPAPQRTLLILKSLLSSGADVNAHKAAALCHAIAARNGEVTDLILQARPQSTSLQAAMPHALKIPDPMDRLTFTQKLLDAGAPAIEANRALVFAVNAYSDDLALINTLVSNADSSDGDAMMRAVRKERPDMVELILARSKRKYTVPILNNALVEAAKAQDRDSRNRMCELLLKAGASGTVVSDALLAAAARGDLTLGAVLLANGASLEHQEGQAVVEACRAGAADVVKMLMSTDAAVKETTLSRGFQAATQVGDLKARAAVFHLLLEKGITGEVVDAQLVSAARFGDDAADLVRLLLEFGASTDYNSGEAVWNATRCAFLDILQMMLGIVKVGDRQHKPSHSTMVRALKASWRLSPEPRYKVIEWLFQAGLPATEDVHVGLHKAVNDDEPNMELIQLLLKNGASPLSNGCQTLIDATQKLRFPILDLFFQTKIPPADIKWAFSQAFGPEDASRWLSEDGLRVAQRLLEKGAGGEGLSGPLAVAIDHYGSERDANARRFVELLVQNEADVDWKDGLPLRKAAKRADLELLRQLLQKNPNTRSLSMAFPYLFDHELPEDQALEMITLFTEHDGEGHRLDVMFAHPESDPVVFRAIWGYPRSTKILEALLHAGYYYDQMGVARILEEAEEDEPVNLLTWALLQPQKRTSSAVINMLIDRGAKVNFETRISKTTPLMLAIQHRRQDLVKSLILAGAEVDVADITGNTPLTMATRIGGELGTLMMTNLLAAEPSKNDGSLHNAARELNLRAMQVLVEFGHDVDFPSPLHGGRSALGELCLHASDGGQLTAAKEKAMEKAMGLLIANGSDLGILSQGKSVLLLAFEAFDSFNTTKALLKVGMWKHINKPSNCFSDGTYTYSPTMYVSRVLPASDTQEQLLTLLKANRAKDIYYANNGPQPDDAVGAPDHLLVAEHDRKARLERIKLEAEDHARALARRRESAALQDQISAQRAELQATRDRRARDIEMAGLREKAALEEELFATAVRRQREERQAALEHAQTLGEAELTRARLVAETEFETEGRRQVQALEWERSMGTERVQNAQQLSAMRVREREDVEKVDKANDARIRSRIQEQKRLVEQQNQLAGRLQAAGVNGRRQIGYVTGELD